MATENESKNSGKMHGKVISDVQRRKSFNNKETARRNLINSIHTRQGDERNIDPTLSSGRMKPEFKLPRVNSKQRSVLAAEYSNICINSESRNSQFRTTVSPNSYMEIVYESGPIYSVPTRESCGYTGKSSGQNISLSEIIKEFNAETNMAVKRSGMHMTSQSAELYDDVRALGVPYENFLNKTKYNKFNPCRSRYRPITPGLLESLHKLKMPSKIKTEQWVRSSQRPQKPQPGHIYQTKTIDNTPNWIYDY